MFYVLSAITQMGKLTVRELRSGGVKMMARRKIINLLEYRNSNIKTADGKITQGELRAKIPTIVHKVNTTKSTDDEISEFISDSFCINGLVEAYNQLGYGGWYRMILQMAEHEVYERNLQYECI